MARYEIYEGGVVVNVINAVFGSDISGVLNDGQTAMQVDDWEFQEPNLKKGYFDLLDAELELREVLPFRYDLSASLFVILGAARDDRADLNDAITTTERVLASINPLATIPIAAENGEFDLAIGEARTLSILMLQRLVGLREKYREMRDMWPNPADPLDDANWS